MLFQSHFKDIHCSTVVFRYPYRAKVLLQSTKIYNSITKHFLNVLFFIIVADEMPDSLTTMQIVMSTKVVQLNRAQRKIYGHHWSLIT